MSTTRVKVSRWKAWFEGWQGGVIAVSLGGVGLLLGAPRPTVPLDVPLPIAEPRKLAGVHEQEHRRARELASASERERSGGQFELRELGRVIRQYGEADAAEEHDLMATLRHGMLKLAREVLERDGSEPLLRLRAYQLELFQKHLAGWEATGHEAPELKQLGAGFVKLALASQWVRPPRRLLADGHVRAALFKRRFAEILALQGNAEFALTLDENRALYAFFLAYPPIPADNLGEAAHQERAWQWRLRKAEELGKLDPSYPTQLARGIALLHLKLPMDAALALRGHLAASPDGPYTLRARNHLAAAVEQTEGQRAAPP